MNTKPLSLASNAKGPFLLCRRAIAIARRYGLTAAKMDPVFGLFARTLNRFSCGASFPVTAVTMQSHADSIKRCFENADIELAVHGYTHVDYSRLPLEVTLTHLKQAREIFTRLGIAPSGYRAPYLRRDPRLIAAIAETGFSYSSNQPIVWDVVDLEELSVSARKDFERAVAFYDPWYARERPSLPKLVNGLVEIPVSLPDDEILLDRMQGSDDRLAEKSWQRILVKTHQGGELFTLQLHPERIARCEQALISILATARSLEPAVWFARLDQIADWWRSRTNAAVKIVDTGKGGLHISVSGPAGTVVLMRGVEVDVPTIPWADGYCQIVPTSFTLTSAKRPIIGLSDGASPELADFLRQQGYITEVGKDIPRYSYYFDQSEFNVGEERTVLGKIEESGFPLIKLGRWPKGARSALAVTGDIDAVTLWDYGQRFFGG